VNRHPDHRVKKRAARHVGDEHALPGDAPRFAEMLNYFRIAREVMSHLRSDHQIEAVGREGQSECGACDVMRACA
jgi:hypothetical protein